MNKKASETLMDNFVYLILLVIFISILGFYIWSQMNGASIYSDYYSKEITKIINTAKPGDTINLDVHKATEIAQKNDIPLSRSKELFTFNNPENEVCVKLSKGRKTCYHYFNDVDIINPEVKLGVPTNKLVFEIIEVQKDEEQI
jgi:hypothetical protein